MIQRTHNKHPERREIENLDTKLHGHQYQDSFEKEQGEYAYRIKVAQPGNAYHVLHWGGGKEPRPLPRYAKSSGSEAMKHANVLTPVDGLHYEPPAMRCYEANDHVQQNSNGILGKDSTDHWTPCMRTFQVANYSSMQNLANSMAPNNRQTRAEGYPMLRASHAGKMTASNLAHVSVGLADPSKRGNIASWVYAKPGATAYPSTTVGASIKHQADFPERDFYNVAPPRSMRGSYASSRASSRSGLPPGAMNVRLYHEPNAWVSTAHAHFPTPSNDRPRTAGRAGALGNLNLRCTSNMVRDQIQFGQGQAY